MIKLLSSKESTTYNFPYEKENKTDNFKILFFLELRRKEKEIYYHTDRSSECDFVVVEKGRVTQAIQVTYEMENKKTRAREFKGLVNACKQYGLNEGLIITYGEEGSYELVVTY